MSDLLECVPNFSEGRNKATIQAIADRIRRAANVRLLNIHQDADHNRSVFTIAGPSLPLQHAIFEAAAVAVEMIDLTRHTGEHPRMGAVDVIPFISLEDTPGEAAVEAANVLGARIGRELEVPVFLYGHAATNRNRRDLPNVRRIGLAANPSFLDENHPDFGPPHRHPTAGACAVGARDFLVAFNVSLQTRKAAVAQEIARAIRASSGGVAGIRALGFMVEGRAQVSMNLYDLRKVTLRMAWEIVCSEANKRGVEVHSGEVVGLVPELAVRDLTTTDDLRLNAPINELVLERKLAEDSKDLAR